MNIFTYITSANSSIRTELFVWDTKIQEYLEFYYNNQMERIRGTEFGDCISKVRYLIERVVTEPEYFRGVQDTNGRLQAGAMVEEYFDCLYIDTLTNAPWNVIKNRPETVKGAATSMVEGLVRESIALGYNGRLRVISIARSKSFYIKIGFIEDEENASSMELTPIQAERFLLQQRIRRQKFHD
jgi:hypothetical protein